MIRPAIPGLTGLFVNHIYCIGRNYVAHALELNNPIPDQPVIFTKPSTSIIFDGGTVQIPGFTKDVHHETEVVVAIGKKGKNIPVGQAASHIAGYGIGIDVTARDIQNQLKAKAHPWDIAKGLDTFAPISAFVPAEKIADDKNLVLELRVNGELRQSGTTAHMIFPIDVLISKLSDYFTLQPGDLIFTGTPEGVAQIKAGDSLHAVLGANITSLTVDVADA